MPLAKPKYNPIAREGINQTNCTKKVWGRTPKGATPRPNAVD